MTSSPDRRRLAWTCCAGVCLALLALGAAGCSTPISVRYSPLPAAESLTTSDSPKRIFVVKYLDAREEGASIGAMKNIYGGKVKTLVTTDNLEGMLSEATTDALRKAGLRADLHTDRATGEDVPPEEFKGYDFVIGGRIKIIDVQSRPGWDTLKITARVVIDIAVTKAGKTEWLGPIEGTAERREMNVPGTSVLTETLDIATQNCMRNMIRHIKASGALQ